MLILEQTIVDLISRERFYAELLLRMNKIFTNKIPTAGVNVKDKVNLYINPEFFQRLSKEERMGVLIHECQHILHDHIYRAKELHPELYEKDKDIADSIINSAKHQVLNISMDCAINSLNHFIPKEMEVFDGKEWTKTKPVFPENFNLPPKEAFEYYLEKLKQQNKDDFGDNYIDDHSLWGESEGDKEILKEKVKKLVNEAAKTAKEVGQLSSEHELLLSRLNHKARDWKADIKRFVSRSNQTYIDTSRKKRNRRYGILFPGNIKYEKLHIATVFDTSGSMSDEALNQIFAEIHSISKNNVEITVIEADSEVKDFYKFDPKKQIKVKGRGGTAYNPALQKAKELEVDAILYFGDFDISDTPEDPKIPVLWVGVDTEQQKPASFGYVTYVKINNKT